MNPERPSREMLADYIHRYCDETITADELAQLEAWLAGDAASLEQFLLSMEIHSALAWPTRMSSPSDDRSGEPDKTSSGTLAVPALSHAALISDDSACPLSGGQSPAGDGLMAGFKMLFRPPIVFFTILSAGLTGAVISYQFSHSPASNQSPEAQVSLGPVAYLTSAKDCLWGGMTFHLNSVGDGVPSESEIVLREGVAEFRLSSGVSFIVAGPARLRMTSSSLLLDQGKVTVSVPWVVADFKLNTPSCHLQASDTEFGVNIAGNKTDIHVFSGQVLAAPTLDRPDETKRDFELVVEREDALLRGTEFSKFLIAAGRGLELVQRDEVSNTARWHFADPARFAANATTPGALPLVPAYVNAVIAVGRIGDI